MPWSLPDNVPSVVKNKPVEQQRACIFAANSALERGSSEEEAIFACISAAKNAVKAPKQAVEKRLLPSKVQTKAKIEKAFLGPNALDPEASRSLVYADFDEKGVLTLRFDTGEEIKTKPVQTNVDVEQYVTVSPTKIIEGGGSTPPQDIAVRVTAVDTTITEADDILVVTDEATVSLPDADDFTKTVRIKRAGSGDVTIEPENLQTIDGSPFIVLNINFYSVDLHAVAGNWIIL